ncbi:hypothetical protein GA0061099_10408 [Bradyrhizobium yuanmingense]|uniref:Uncharacterized protein n=1 Tax=Bradyrhizobium yuanmingense TaxID=108015 RepID=A0A1C3XKK5_9BRAD|nr:hypothetical protein [Bradyrhizobium yuanmingense]TWI17065.1 hypothetical protein IQ15_07544 [Bradyrhizobium yuanmingense]SCB52790.1 hypothetical protein GA0061099_10408 [Bradyrhizobium yuanmingense]
MLQVLHLRGLEIIEQLPRLAGVIALTNHEPYPSLLLKDVALALSYVPLGFFQMSELHRAVHATAYHKEDDLGARKILLFSIFLGIMSRRVAPRKVLGGGCFRISEHCSTLSWERLISCSSIVRSIR